MAINSGKGSQTELSPSAKKLDQALRPSGPKSLTEVHRIARRNLRLSKRDSAAAARELFDQRILLPVSHYFARERLVVHREYYRMVPTLIPTFRDGDGALVGWQVLRVTGRVETIRSAAKVGRGPSTDSQPRQSRPPSTRSARADQAGSSVSPGR